jgi:hypothetical protein
MVREKVGEARGRTMDVRGIGEVGLGRASCGGGVTDNARGGETCPEWAGDAPGDARLDGPG